MHVAATKAVLELTLDKTHMISETQVKSNRHYICLVALV